ncbi:hypothetical protein [Aliamphritea ceti]|uniref:hypothetical protein n=1 Tax=Aliamphritea ceti TaxID=1524258 RepID=UPI0021C27F1E|nr:hypothetical protein [Aliamphritea ceti]
MTILKVLLITSTFILMSNSHGYVTQEESIYEPLLLKVIGNTYDKAYLINLTDSEWFRTTPLEKVINRNKNVKIDPQLLEKLYTVNKTQYPIEWQPILVNITILPSSIHRSKDIEIRCGINAQNRTFRAYHTLSKVAFSADGTKAIVKHGIHCAPLSGARQQIVVFIKEGDFWIISKLMLLSIS